MKSLSLFNCLHYLFKNGKSMFETLTVKKLLIDQINLLTYTKVIEKFGFKITNFLFF